MAKTKISEFSATAADNTDITNINIAEGCSPANVNNSIRSLMALLKDQQVGTSGDNFSVGGNLAVTGTTTLTTALPIASGGTGATTAAASPFATKGANSDITSLTGITTPITTAQGGTGTSSTTFANLATNVTGTLPVANGGTGVTTLTSGSVLVGAGTSTPTFVAPTTAGNVLFTTNGTSWSSAAKITSGTLVASTSGTNIDFTGIPSWVKRITVMFNGVSTTGSDVLVQLGSGSFTTTGYLSYSGYVGSGGTAVGSNTSGLYINIGGNAGSLIYGSMNIQLIGSNSWVEDLVTSTNTGGTVFLVPGSGSIALSGTLDRVRITTADGTSTFDAGSINIFYE